MSNTETKSSGLSLPLVIVGAILMVGGMYLSTTLKDAQFLKDLAAQGIPVDPGKTVASIGVFLILFQVIKVFFINPLHDAIQNRTEELERTFTEAEQLRAELTTMRADYEKRIAATEASAREQIQAQVKEAQNLRTQLMAEASAKADELVTKAEQDIAAAKEKVLLELRTQVVDVALAAAERVIGENMNDDRNRRLVEEFVSRVEVKN